MEKKYELIKEDSITVDGFKLFRIRALKDFFVVKAGELGGYIEHEGCLSHEGYAWVYDNAKVYNAGKIADSGRVSGNAIVTCGSKVMGFAGVGGNAVVDGISIVTGSSYVDRGVYLKSVTLINDANISSTNFLSDLRIGFDVKEGNTVATYEDPNFSIRNIAASRVSNQFTTWNASGTVEEIINAQCNDEEKAKMRTMLQAHMDIYNIQ